MSCTGVEMPFGEAPPGARGVLAVGQTLKVAEYKLTTRAPAEVDRQPEPDALFNREQSARGGSDSARNTGSTGATDLTPFFQGLGLDPAGLGPLSPGELETIGKLVRTLALGCMRRRQE